MSLKFFADKLLEQIKGLEGLKKTVSFMTSVAQRKHEDLFKISGLL